MALYATEMYLYSFKVSGYKQDYQLCSHKNHV